MDASAIGYGMIAKKRRAEPASAAQELAASRSSSSAPAGRGSPPAISADAHCDIAALIGNFFQEINEMQQEQTQPTLPQESLEDHAPVPPHGSPLPVREPNEESDPDLKMEPA